MNQRQAKALLELVADLYTLASTPEPPPEPAPNGARSQPENVATKGTGK